MPRLWIARRRITRKEGLLAGITIVPYGWFEAVVLAPQM